MTDRRGTKKSAPKLPSGREVMKRRAPKDLSFQPSKFESDPKKAYSFNQLAEIGAITLKWNQIEGHIDFIGSHILFAKTPFWLKLAVDGAIGTNAKLRLLQQCSANSTLLDEQAKQCIHDCFSEVAQCRMYRNAIIHHHIFDHEKGIGSYIDESNSSFQIIVSLEALQILFKVMCAILDEIREIDLLFRIETDAQRPGRLNADTHQFEPFSDDVLRLEIIPDQTKRILKLQETRRALQKLPTFPDAAQIRAFNYRVREDG